MMRFGVNRDAGLTIVELLVTVAILSIVLGVLGNYFASEVRTFRQVNARTNAQDKARFVMAIVGQDLQLAGASRFVSEETTGTRKPTGLVNVAFDPCSATNRCVSTTSPATTVKDSVNSRYITSLRDSSNACRKVAYTFTGDTLNRSDIACSATAAVPDELAQGVLAMNVQYICSFAGTVAAPNVKDLAADCDDNPATATASDGFVKAARITLYVASDSTTATTSGSFNVAGTTLTCPANRFCAGLSQEVPLPNLKK